MADAGVDVGRGAGECRVAGLVAVAGQGRVGNAPVHAARVIVELGTGLAGPVAERDHVVESTPDEAVQVAGALVGDVDAVLVAQHPYGVGMQVWLGAAADARDYHMSGGVVA